MANVNVLVDISEASEVSLNGQPIPGIYQSLELSGDLRIDRVQRSGRSGAAKLPEGWDDMKLVLRLLLLPDTAGGYPATAARKIASLFQQADKNAKPYVYEIAHPLTSALNLREVLFKTLRVSASNQDDSASAELEFVEWRPVVVKRERQAKAKVWSLGGAITQGLAAAPASALNVAKKIGGASNNLTAAVGWAAKAATGKLAAADMLYTTLPKGVDVPTFEQDVFSAVGL
ncbi:MAG: hypothetical protein HUU55_07670 [Myxococcales bacterium]|nr:hypothetical protein [Myxococcales bacterium]